MSYWNAFQGSMHIEIISAAPEQLLSAANDAGIILYNVAPVSNLKVNAVVLRKDYKRLEQLLSRRGEAMKVLSKRGIYWSLIGITGRPVLLAGLLIYLLALFYIPTKVFFIFVEGNQSVTTWQILDTAHSHGLSFGSTRREIRSEKIKNALLESIPQLQWAGVNTRGCVATISVLEKSDVPSKIHNQGIHGIYASRDGIIMEMTVKKGNSICKIGQAVRTGQLLISGYTDCGLVIKAESADAEVYALTNRTFETIAPVNYRYRDGYQKNKIRYSLLIGKKLINFFKTSRISDTSCVKMYKEYYLTLPGGFRLPVALIKETFTSSTFYEKQFAKPEDFSWVEDHASAYVKSQMVSGRIIKQSYTNKLRDNLFYQHAKFACYEMISQGRGEEITNAYRKTD